jgi:hypothetical protein
MTSSKIILVVFLNFLKIIQNIKSLKMTCHFIFMTCHFKNVTSSISQKFGIQNDDKVLY